MTTWFLPVCCCLIATFVIEPTNSFFVVNTVSSNRNVRCLPWQKDSQQRDNFEKTLLFGAKTHCWDMNVGKVTATAVCSFLATAVLFSSPLPAMSMTGTVVEGPSNAEMVELTLKPNEQLVADYDTLVYLSDDISFRSEFRGEDISKRFISGARLGVNAFTNEGSKPGIVGLATQLPSRILPIQLEDYPGNTIIGHEHSFLAAPNDVQLQFDYEYLKGGDLFTSALRMERISGTGTIYLTGSGNLIQKQLKQGERLKLFPGAWVAMTDTMELTSTKGRTNTAFASRLLEVEGPGTIWIDTAPISRIVDTLDKLLPRHS